jgi:hypothetical protein
MGWLNGRSKSQDAHDKRLKGAVEWKKQNHKVTKDPRGKKGK